MIQQQKQRQEKEEKPSSYQHGILATIKNDSGISTMSSEGPSERNKQAGTIRSLVSCGSGLAGVLVVIALGLAVKHHQLLQPSFWRSSRTASLRSYSSSSSLLESSGSGDSGSFPMPSGVNLGSWLSLEDYFYVGERGAVEVATPDSAIAAVCLPPLHTGQKGSPPWHSETDLLASLMAEIGLPKALKVFHAHRTSFITEHDLQTIQSWGIHHVRVPVSWCFTESDPDSINMTDTNDTNSTYHQQLIDQFTCTDPYYPGVLWPAIPELLLQRFLRNCAKYGITASLDIHTYPGATSPGTFSGLWPRPPLFWKHDDPDQTNKKDLGRKLFRGFVKWMESLQKTDPLAFAGLRGIGPMNEPAHLAGLFATLGSAKDFLPPLPEDVEQAYLQDKMMDDPTIPNGPHLRVLLWLHDAIDTFRKSSLPGLGKQLHVNIHESFLQKAVLPVRKSEQEDDGRHDLIAAWWNHATTRTERKTWAVLDMHHYHAWDPYCSGASDGPPSGNYSCDNVPERTAALQRCTTWAKESFRAAVDRQCGTGAKLMSGEFSASTNHKVLHACNDIDTLRATYLAQVSAAHSAKVEMYYWSYKMPNGGAFKSAWSFSQLLYLMGISNRPDESNYPCGPSSIEGQGGGVSDDWFGL